MRCPICYTDEQNNNSICDCGYSFNEKEIQDWDRAKNFLALIPKSEWFRKVEIENNINNVQIKKHGQRHTNLNIGWSIRETGRRLGLSDGKIAEDLQLAEALKNNPELKKIKDITKAKNDLRESKRNLKTNDKGSVFTEEYQLHRYLFDHWDRLSFFDEWEINGAKYNMGKFKTNEVWEIDILAKHKQEPKWLVVELKNEQSSDVTIGQISRYMGWIKRNKAKKDEEVEGLIISHDINLEILYALYCNSKIRLCTYNVEDDVLKLSERKLESELLLNHLKKLSIDELDELKESLKKLEVNSNNL
ncbi:DUF1016 family protein [bacterium]|nr:DUF1016 family protein [FCB group bacterium]MBL7191000.1 DUF1016 family protein [bacterium]